jgi:hypothetical protein
MSTGALTNGNRDHQEDQGAFSAKQGRNQLMFRRSSKQSAGGRAEPISLVRRTPPPIRRALAVVALAALAGLAAFVATRNDPKTYERDSSFAIQPGETVTPQQMTDVVGSLAQPDNAVTQTIVDILGSGRLRETAAKAAGLPPASVGGSGATYSWIASRRPGSAVIDLKLTGPDDAKLAALQAAAPPAAASVVTASFGLYRLESLDAATAPTQVGPKTAQTVTLAVLLGAFLGIALVVAEGRLRSALRTRPADRGDFGPPAPTTDGNGGTGRLESTLRESFVPGAFVRGPGPGRIASPYSEAQAIPESPRPGADHARPLETAPKPETERSKPERSKVKTDGPGSEAQSQESDGGGQNSQRRRRRATRRKRGTPSRNRKR